MMIRIPVLFSAVLLCLSPGMEGRAQAPEREPAEFREVVPGLYFNYDKSISNSVVLITGEGVLVVDTRMHPRDAELLLAEIRKHTDAPVRWVINTQFHGDHHMGNSVFRDEGATIIQHRDTRAIIQERFDFEVGQRPFDQLGYDRNEVELVLPDVLFDSELTLELGGVTVELYYLGPGQNEGDTLVYFSHARALHTAGVFHNQSWANTSYTPSMAGWMDVIEKMKSIGAEIYLPPHGELASVRDVDAFAVFLDEIHQGVKQAIADGLSADEMTESLTFDAYQSWRGYNRRARNLNAIYELLTTGESSFFVPSSTAGGGSK
jgi:cyclase